MSKQSILPQVRENFKIDSLVKSRQNIGAITPDEAQAQNAKLFSFEYGSCESGLALKLYWALSSEERIVDCKIEVFGESELIAAASIAALISKNKTPDEILQLKEKGLEYFLRENPNKAAFPLAYRYITNILTDALYQMAKSYKKELEEESIIDPQSNVSDRFIRQSIKNFNIQTLQELRDYTRAGAFSTTQHNPHYPNPLEETLKSVQQELQEQEKASQNIPDKPFKQMSVEEKRAAIEAIIDQHIRQMLIMDGGDMEILDIKENGEDTDIYIRYLGACNGCASASTGTLFAIEGMLKQKLDSSIRVIPL